MTDLYDVPDEPSPEAVAEEQAQRRRTRVWVPIAALVVVILVVACVWLIERGFGGSGAAAPSASVATSPAAATDSPSASAAIVTPGSSPTSSSTSRLLTAAEAEDQLLTFQELDDADLGLGAPTVTAAWTPRLSQADPPDCALLIETISAAPAGFAGETALGEQGQSFVQRVYLFDSAQAASTAFAAVSDRAAGCRQFAATAAGPDQQPVEQTFDAKKDTGQLTGVTFDRGATPADGAATTGWQRTFVIANVVIELDYLGPDAGPDAQEAVFSLFATAESRVIDSVTGSGG